MELIMKLESWHAMTITASGMINNDVRAMVAALCIELALAQSDPPRQGEQRLYVTSSRGGPLRHRNFYARHLKPAVMRAGLLEATPFHDLCHSYGTMLIA